MMIAQNSETEAAASVVANLAAGDNKRAREEDDNINDATYQRAAKAANNSLFHDVTGSTKPTTSNDHPHGSDVSRLGLALRPYPYFFYRNFSTVTDPDPLTPLTAPGRVPNFPAKMHSILSRTDLADIIAWMPHGRSWRVLKPREFEVRVIPTYFEHAKFSSFVRQANGWGFRRITQGPDRNTYYHELFLRGLPYLCKMMKRPGVSEKRAASQDHEPDFTKISEQYPVPERNNDVSVLLPCTLHGGPKARMPIYLPNAISPGGRLVSGSSTLSRSHNIAQMSNHSIQPPGVQMGTYYQNNGTVTEAPNPPTHHIPCGSSSDSYQSSFAVHPVSTNPQGYTGNQDQSAVPAAPSTQPHSSVEWSSNETYQDSKCVVHSAHDVQQPCSSTNNGLHAGHLNSNPAPQLSAAPSGTSASDQYAAGFAAATALSQQQFRNILSQALASLPASTQMAVQQQFSQVASQPCPQPEMNQQAPQQPPNHGMHVAPRLHQVQHQNHQYDSSTPHPIPLQVVSPQMTPPPQPLAP